MLTVFKIVSCKLKQTNTLLTVLPGEQTSSISDSWSSSSLPTTGHKLSIALMNADEVIINSHQSDNDLKLSKHRVHFSIANINRERFILSSANAWILKLSNANVRINLNSYLCTLLPMPSKKSHLEKTQLTSIPHFEEIHFYRYFCRILSQR